MPDFSAQVFVCTNAENAEDQRHCGDKSGPEIRARFNELLVKHGLIESVGVNNVGCRSQHRLCEVTDGSITVFGPKPEMGGVWYVVGPDDVEEIITEHLIGGRVVERLVNSERAVKFA